MYLVDDDRIFCNWVHHESFASNQTDAFNILFNTSIDEVSDYESLVQNAMNKHLMKTEDFIESLKIRNNM